MSDYDKYETIKIEVSEGVATCTLNRPDALNAVTRQMHKELELLFGEIGEDRDVRAIVLTGAGRAFCAGGDVKEMDSTDVADDRPAGIFDSGARRVVANLLGIPQPIIAAVNGVAVGLGATLALLCDVVFMAESARIGDTHVSIGLVPGDGGAVIWPLLVGPARAKEYLLTGDLIPAPEAERIGLVNHVVDNDKVLDDALAFAGRLADGPTMAIRLTKHTIQRTILQQALNSMDVGLALESITGTSHDYTEATTAWAEKRTPEFKGR
jgi:enoyl-CoA hydratase